MAKLNVNLLDFDGVNEVTFHSNNAHRHAEKIKGGFVSNTKLQQSNSYSKKQSKKSLY